MSICKVCKETFTGIVWLFGGSSGCKKCADRYLYRIINRHKKEKEENEKNNNI